MLLDYQPQPTKNFHYEADFQVWFQEQVIAHYDNQYVMQHKLSDQALNRKPCDYFYFDEIGRAYFCELKVIPGYTINISKFEYQQVEFLTELFRRESGHSFPYAVIYSEKVGKAIYLPW